MSNIATYPPTERENRYFWGGKLPQKYLHRRYTRPNYSGNSNISTRSKRKDNRPISKNVTVK